jgi:IclR family KDG regulon transcriptional repressor
MNPNESATIFTMVQILSLFSVSREEIGVREVSSTLNISPSKVHRLLNSLTACGFLEKNLHHKYRLGERIFSIGSLYPLHYPPRKIVRPHLEELAKSTGVEVQLGILSKQQLYSAIIIDRIISPSSSDLINRILLNVPLHSSAIGKTLLAFMDEKERENILKGMFLKKYTENTITDIKSLLAELKKIKENGMAWDHKETHYGIVCAGVPLFEGNICVGAISMTGIPTSMSKPKVKRYTDELRERAVFISRQL